MTEPIGIGLIGCGNIAGLRHLPALAGLSGARVVALADPDRSSLEGLADRYRVPGRYPHAETLLEDPAVEVVGVLVPPALHTEVLLATLEAGKHALVEKPLALSTADSERILERAGRSPAKVAVGFNLRAHALVQRARELVAAGLVGPIESIAGALGGSYEPASGRTWDGWRFDQRLGGGALFEKGAHHYDLWRLFTGGEVAEVSAISRRVDGTDRSTVVSARMEGDALANVVLGEYGPAVNRLSLVGARGQIDLSLLQFDGLRFTPSPADPGDARTRLRGLGQALRELPRGLRAMREGGEYLVSYRREWELFLDAIRGDRPVHCSLEDGHRALEIAIAAVASAVDGRVATTTAAPIDLETALAGSREPLH